jgi:hypothetical protein
MSTAPVPLRLGLVALVLAALPATAVAGSKGPGYQTGFARWAGDELSSFRGEGVRLDGLQLALDLATAAEETDPGEMYNGGTFKVGEATGPILPVSLFGISEAIASWNVTTPSGTWVEVLLRAQIGGRWTKWYNMGVWASETDTVQRHSVRLQGDADGYVATDTLVLVAKKATASALQLKVRLFSANGEVPTVQRFSLEYNSAAPTKFSTTAGNPDNWNTLLDVSECSQMVYPDGGNVWCSPTSTSMVLGFWGIDPGPCEPRVRNVVNGVYDYVYDGHGNWPFNTAYAASRGMEAYVARYAGLDKVEPWVKAGVPVVVSYAWKKGQLTGAPIESSSGHLGVIVGFDASGNPIVNDPAAARDDAVQRTYLRSEFEPLWLGNSGGTVYLVYPPGYAVPAL